MNAVRLTACIALLLLPACQEERSTGTTTETENAVAARTIAVDSVVHSADRPWHRPFVATLRFDAANFDFTQSADSGLDLDVRTVDGASVPFETVFWDSAAARGRLHVRISGALLLPGARFSLCWRLPKSHRSDSAATWAGISDSQKLAANSSLVDDFEGGSLLRNRLPDSSFWYVGGSLAASGLSAAGSGRSGTAIHLACNAGQCDAGRPILAATLLAASPRCFRSLDSLVLWVRGSGSVWISFEVLDSAQLELVRRGHIDSLKQRRAWGARTLDNTWQRISLRPADLDPADGVDGNEGWMAVRDSINYLTFLIEGGTDLWLDDIRFHGIAPDDLR